MRRQWSCAALAALLAVTGMASAAPVSAANLESSIAAASATPPASAPPHSAPPATTTPPAAPVQTSPAKVKIGGELVAFPQAYPAVIRQDRLFVPIRFFEHAGIQAQVSSYDATGEADLLIKNFRSSIQMKIGQETYRYFLYKDEQNFTRTAAGMSPYWEGGQPMVPLRPVAEALGLEVSWDSKDRAAVLLTDDAYRGNLHTAKDWSAWLGDLPADENYESVAAISDADIKQYILDGKLDILDYKLVSKYKAVVLEVRGEETSVYAILRSRNGKLKSEDVTYWTEADEEGFSAKRGYGFVGVVVHEKGQSHEIEYGIVNTYYNQGEVKKEKVTFDTGKFGLLVKLPTANAAGTVYFYGKNGYSHEVRFW